MGALNSQIRRIRKVSGTSDAEIEDHLAVEEPLEIQVAYGLAAHREIKTVAITMRTPGRDRELAAGFLVGESMLRSIDELEAVHTRGPRLGDEGGQNSVRVTLRPGVKVNLDRLQRNFYTTSSCGVCGKTSLEALEMSLFPALPAATFQVDDATIRDLPRRLREAQPIFEETGGLHAAGLFTPSGELIVAREDVGRHNAVDKAVGSQFLAGRGSLANSILVVSGRASFELMQKAIASGIPMLVAVGAPSSLAVDVAQKFGATLIGFTKPTGYNVYSGPERVRCGEESFMKEPVEKRLKMEEILP
jgi:FdhD protein